MTAGPLPARSAPQDEGAPAKDARAIVEAATAAIEKAGTATYRVTLEPHGQAAALLGTFEGGEVTVGSKIEDATIPFRRPFRITATHVTETGAQRIEVVFDGTRVREILHDERSYSDEDVTGGGFMMRDAYFLVLPGWTNDFAPRDAAESRFEYLGEETVNGVRCDVVVLDQGLPADAEHDEESASAPKIFVRTRLVIGADDRLPRRATVGIRREAASGIVDDPWYTVSASDLRIDVPVEAKTFALAAPEGYAEHKAPVPNPEPEPKLHVGDEAPAWTLADPDGDEHSLADFRGKIVLMDFWATWCGPCKTAMPSMQRLHERFRDRGLVVIGIDVFDQGDAVALMKSKNLDYLCLLRGDAVAEAYGVRSIPQFFVVGKDGKIAHHTVGYEPQHEEALAGVLEGLLGPPSK